MEGVVCVYDNAESRHYANLDEGGFGVARV